MFFLLGEPARTATLKASVFCRNGCPYWYMRVPGRTYLLLLLFERDLHFIIVGKLPVICKGSPEYKQGNVCEFKNEISIVAGHL